MDQRHKCRPKPINLFEEDIGQNFRTLHFMKISWKLHQSMVNEKLTN